MHGFSSSGLKCHLASHRDTSRAPTAMLIPANATHEHCGSICASQGAVVHHGTLQFGRQQAQRGLCRLIDAVLGNVCCNRIPCKRSSQCVWSNHWAWLGHFLLLRSVYANHKDGRRVDAQDCALPYHFLSNVHGQTAQTNLCTLINVTCPAESPDPVILPDCAKTCCTSAKVSKLRKCVSSSSSSHPDVAQGVEPIDIYRTCARCARRGDGECCALLCHGCLFCRCCKCGLGGSTRLGR
mmetsp:Transcript_138155/g.240313  ORF Transcript_138155/g.240313 Transcript_138155/m.240313 type:complete len:239 (-) Transcript_138155:611-1327(-)